jgi:predicted ester cyclase
MYLTAFPDLHLTIEDLIAEGDKVVDRQTARGTHQGTFMGIPPTGKQITVTAMNISRIVGGKIVEHWVELDTLGMLQQLGVVPMPGQAG